MFGFFRKKKPATKLDEFIIAVYGNSPPPKRANLQDAIRLASNDLLMGNVQECEIRSVAEYLNEGTIPYSTHDLALSIALPFFKRPEHMLRLRMAQLLARVKMLEWLQAGLVAPALVKIFEDALYNLYKPE